jgi:VWFA-related protein
MLIAQTPSFRVATRLIQVNVIVTDHRGAPVTGLARDAFEILDQGLPQKLAFFSEQKPAPANPAAQTERKSAMVFSNRPDENAPGPRSVTVVLFDRLNTRFEDAGFAKARLEKFLGGVRADDRIALYGLSDRLVILHDFTEDAAALKRALDEFKPAETMETKETTFKESRTGHPAMDFLNNRGDQTASDISMTGRVLETAAALEAIAHHLAGIPGRKNLVWVSNAFPINIGTFQRRIPGARPQKDDYSAQVDKAAQALSNADVSIYPVDAQGLMPPQGDYNAVNARQQGVRQLSLTLPTTDLAPIAERETMQNLADTTGGLIFFDTNDIGGAVRRAIDDSAYTYTVGYYPDHGEWDGKFREIKVKVNRPGVEVRSRRGYLAVADAPSTASPVSMEELIRRPLELNEVGISVEAEKVADRQFKIHLRFDTSAVRFEQKDGRWNAQLEVLWEELGEDGRNVAGHGQTLTFRLSPETYAKLPEDGLKISSVETVDEKAVELRFAARDPATGAAGSVYIPVHGLIER